MIKNSHNNEISITDNQNLTLSFSEGNSGEAWFAIDTNNLEDAILELKSKNCTIIELENNQNGVLVKDPFGFKFYLAKRELD